MKKIALLLTAWIYSLTLFTSAFSLISAVDGLGDIDGMSIVLPASLVEIGASAFENTSAETVVIPASASIIRDRAFAENIRLGVVSIPESITYMEDNVFDGSLNVTIRAVENSYAAVWARIHNVAFIQNESVHSSALKLANLFQRACIFSLSFGFIHPKIQCWQRRRTRQWIISLRPQDRPELNPIDYKFP